MSFLDDLGKYLFSEGQIKKYAIPGNCRQWTRAAYLETVKVAKKSALTVEVEAREKIISKETAAYHTFLRVTIGDENYVYDGTGLPMERPWWGAEKGSWYEGSRRDMIQKLIEIEINK